MRGSTGLVAALLLVTCSACARDDGLLPTGKPGDFRGRPAKFDRHPDFYDGKTIYVTGYATFQSHWWDNAIWQSVGGRGSQCLILENTVEDFDSHDIDYHREWMTVKGIFEKDGGIGWIGACHGPNALIVDGAWMAKHHPDFYHPLK